MQGFDSINSFRRKAKHWRVVHEQSKKPLEVEVKKGDSFVLATWKTFCQLTSIHGVHYLTESSFHLVEKIIWAIAILAALFGMSFCSVLLQQRFANSKIATVFESTQFSVAEIPFAAVVICNNNRINYTKTEEAVEKFVGNNTEAEKEIFVKFVRILQNQEFGSFDEYEVLMNESVRFLDRLNISEVYEFMMHDCDKLFVTCRFRDDEFNCCDLFSKQISMYGICWSFNSLTNAGNGLIDVSLQKLS